jgi:hypothetical protein
MGCFISEGFQRDALSVTGTRFLRGRVVRCDLPPGAAVVAFRSDRGSARAIRCSCVVKTTEVGGLRRISGDFATCGERHTLEILAGMHRRLKTSCLERIWLICL